MTNTTPAPEPKQETAPTRRERHRLIDRCACYYNLDDLEAGWLREAGFRRAEAVRYQRQAKDYTARHEYAHADYYRTYAADNRRIARDLYSRVFKLRFARRSEQTSAEREAAAKEVQTLLIGDDRWRCYANIMAIPQTETGLSYKASWYVHESEEKPEFLRPTIREAKEALIDWLVDRYAARDAAAGKAVRA